MVAKIWRDDLSYTTSCRSFNVYVTAISTPYKTAGGSFRALKCMLNVQKRKAGDTANVLLSLIERLKTEVSRLPIEYSRIIKHPHIMYLVVFLSVKERKRVQGGR